MANPEHTKILERGVEAWNRWRADNPTIKPNLRKANLEARDLKGIDFRNTDLQRAKLSDADLASQFNRNGIKLDTNLDGANLRDAELIRTKLMGVSLINADLSYTDLISTSLRSANLQNANLSRANLYYTDFAHANLENINFSYAELWGASFGDNDLSTIKGLDTILHRGPSYLSVDTIYRSFYNLPNAFLHGCGIPDELITFLPSLLGAKQAVQFYSCFISYSTKDEEFAKRLYSRMRDEHLRVWFAPEDIKGGQKLREQIEHAIQLQDRLLLVLSENSLQSEWVATEIRKARKLEIKEQRRKLFPIRLVSMKVIQEWECFDADSGKDLAVEVREYFIPSFSDWKNYDAFEIEFKRLLCDLRTEDPC